MNPTTSFSATYFSGKLTAAIPVEVQVMDNLWKLTSADGEAVGEYPLDFSAINDRLANIPRCVIFPDHSSMETVDHAAIDQIPGQTTTNPQRFARLIHLLESHSRFAAVATVLVVSAVGILYAFGIPQLAESVALKLPASIEAEIGQASLASFNALGGTSHLSSAEQDRVRLQLNRVLRTDDNMPELHLRDLGWLPNAFALPGNQIVATDALVEMLSDDEIAAVMAHELGHLHHRHAEQKILLGSSSLLLIAATTGDLSILTSFAGALPLTLIQSGYSRKFEHHADKFAAERMLQIGIRPEVLIEALLKLEADIANDETKSMQFSYLSTHPSNEERRQLIRAVAEDGRNPTSAVETVEGVTP